MKHSTNHDPGTVEVPGDPDKTEEVDYQALFMDLKEREDELQGKYTRLAADYDNFRKRTQRQHQDIVTRANENIICALLPVLDNFGLALATIDDPSIHRGMEMIYSQLLGVLEKEGLAAIPAEGCSFDPAVHEAVARVERQECEENIIIEEIRKGYSLGGKVLRPAMVQVNIKEEE